VLSGFSRRKGHKTPAIMICGPKSSGKSTLVKILTNKLLSDEGNQSSTGVALLDLDPGQPEYSIPGQLSLLHLREPNLGPPFSHPWPMSKNRLIRSHTIAAITPAEDPELYMNCALDLYAHYRMLLSQNPNCCLVVSRFIFEVSP
jgi:polynucleotide 5'-hydroxyl-kinase GRC3/NOL9